MVLNPYGLGETDCLISVEGSIVKLVTLCIKLALHIHQDFARLPEQLFTLYYSRFIWEWLLTVSGNEAVWTIAKMLW
jgi:hypothetical protein